MLWVYCVECMTCCILLCGFRGQTALHKAAWYQRRTICHMLVAAGASLTRLDFQVLNNNNNNNYSIYMALLIWPSRSAGPQKQ